MISGTERVGMGEQQPKATAVAAFAASLGGLDALRTILGNLPTGFPAAILVVRHTTPDHQSRLAELLGIRTLIRVKEAVEGDVLLAATAYVAPPDHHMVVNADGTLSLSRSPRVHFVRPSADPTLQSLALAFKERAVAVVLTGGGSDGSQGAKAVKGMGGTVIVQDKASSVDFSMPKAAINTGCVDFILPLVEIAPALVRLVGGNELLEGGPRPEPS